MSSGVSLCKRATREQPCQPVEQKPYKQPVPKSFPGEQLGQPVQLKVPGDQLGQLGGEKKFQVNSLDSLVQKSTR